MKVVVGFYFVLKWILSTLFLARFCMKISKFLLLLDLFLHTTKLYGFSLTQMSLKNLARFIHFDKMVNSTFQIFAVTNTVNEPAPLSSFFWKAIVFSAT